jgi:hypothetical protein
VASVVNNPSKELGQRGRPDMYPWDEWFDGSIWKLTRGEDFDATTNSMRMMTYKNGERRGIKVKTSIQDENTLLIQAVFE